MKSTMKRTRTLSNLALALVAALLLASPFTTVAANAQAASRFLGTITAISGDSLTVKTDAGEVDQVKVPSSAVLKRIEPGQKDLSTAVAIQFSDLATGDRVLVKLDPDSPAGTAQAQQIIAVKAADVAQKQQKDRDDWQKRGVGGLVKSVDPASGVIVLTSGVGAAAKTITVNTTKSTVIKRYAPASVSFDQAQPSPVDAIHVGDQLRARGDKNTDGTQIGAQEVISGTFRNVSGTISSLDPATSTLVVKDLATKKQMTVHITPDAQMKQLSEQMAQGLAARLKGGANNAAGSGNGQSHNGSAGGGRPGNGAGGGDPQQMLNRLPAIQLSDLKKGEAVMIVSTDGTTDVTAITLLAGVEPLLEAPAASQNMLNNWSMGSGSPDSGGSQ
jgi:hypothetical protein